MYTYSHEQKDPNFRDLWWNNEIPLYIHASSIIWRGAKFTQNIKGDKLPY